MLRSGSDGTLKNVDADFGEDVDGEVELLVCETA